MSDGDRHLERETREPLPPQIAAIFATVEATRAQLKACDAALDSIVASVGSMLYTNALSAARARRDRSDVQARGGLPPVFGEMPEGYAPSPQHFGEPDDAEGRRDPIDRLD